MSYKNNLHPKVSRAEYDVFKELSRLCLTRGMVTQQPITLRATIPDFMWIEKRKLVYLDGVHVHRKKQERDEEIDNLLEVQGWTVLRIPYMPPLTGAEFTRVIGLIREFIGEADNE
ncbi:MAG: DUF559 domain-containing protein [Candidatus Bathyarchaeia archaeon]|jgi:very-short-patch-repair endonuclease